MIIGLQQSKREDLLPLGFAFASLVFKEISDKEWLKRRLQVIEDIFEESWLLREWAEEREEKVKVKALEQGKKQAGSELLQQERMLLVSYVEARFPELLALARECAEVITSLADFNDVMIKLFPLQTTFEVHSYLLYILQRNQA